MLLSSEPNLFLFGFGIFWIIGAILQDLHRREVDNVWNFSLIGIALAYRLAMSIFMGDYLFFLMGLFGLGAGLILGNLFYYLRLFAGGDAKLLIALSVVLPLSSHLRINLEIFGWFILLFLIGGSLYVLVWSLFLVAFNFKRFCREVKTQTRAHVSLFISSLIVVVVWVVFSFFFFKSLLLIGFIFLLFPILFVFAKGVEESCMVKAVAPQNLTEGEWLYEDIFVGGKKIAARWEGVSKRELALIKEKYRRKILIKQGIPFTPGFLIGFLGLVALDFFGFFL